jgi:hypothetical protein
MAKREKVVVRRAIVSRTLEILAFDNTFARVPEAFYVTLNPTPFSEPLYLVSFNSDAPGLIQCRRRSVVE